MEVFKRSFRFVFVMFLSLFLVYCSTSPENDFYDDDDMEFEAIYDIKITKGSEEYHYKGSFERGDLLIIPYYSEKGELIMNVPAGTKVLMQSLSSVESGDLLVSAAIVFDKNGLPYPVNRWTDDESDVFKTIIGVYDKKKLKIFESISGVAVLKDLKLYDDIIVNYVKFATYTLEFEGEFGRIDNDEHKFIEGYSGKGKVVVSKSKKR